MKRLFLFALIAVVVLGLEYSYASDSKDESSSKETALVEPCKMFEDLERQLFRGAVDKNKAKIIMRIIFDKFASIPTVVEEGAGTDSDSAIVFPVLIPKDEKTPIVRSKRLGKKKLSLFDGKSTFDSGFVEIYVPDKDTDGRWDKSAKAIKLVAPESGLVVELTPKDVHPEDPRGRIVGIYAPFSKRIWFIASLSWSNLKIGDRVEAGQLLGHVAPKVSKSNKTIVRIWLFEVKSPSDIYLKDAYDFVKNAQQLVDENISK